MLILGLKMSFLPHFGQNKNFPQKRASPLLRIYWTLSFMQKNNKKSNELTLRKQRYRQTNGQTTRAELIRHSGRAGGTKTLFADFKKNENDAINQLLPTEF